MTGETASTQLGRSDRAIGQNCLDLKCKGANSGEAYTGPPTKIDARTGPWFAAKVTDTPDAFKGLWRIDTYVVKVAACRVAVN